MTCSASASIWNPTTSIGPAISERQEPTVLVIEDDPAIRANVVEILTEVGYLVLEAPSGAMGLEIAERERPHLVLCDVGMRGLDGFGVLSHLRRLPHLRDTAFVFLSGAAAPSNVEAGIGAGAHGYVTKPFTMSALLIAVRSTLEARLVA